MGLPALSKTEPQARAAAKASLATVVEPLRRCVGGQFRILFERDLALLVCRGLCPADWGSRPWTRRFRAGPGWSDDHCRQSDDGIIAQGGHGFQRHVAGALDRPFVILLQKDRADEP